MLVNQTRRDEEHSGFSDFPLWPTQWQSSLLIASILPASPVDFHRELSRLGA
jgi:hypothetical protein